MRGRSGIGRVGGDGGQLSGVADHQASGPGDFCSCYHRGGLAFRVRGQGGRPPSDDAQDKPL